MSESSDGVAGSLYKAASDATSAANPEADDASPAAVGKLFREQI